MSSTLRLHTTSTHNIYTLLCAHLPNTITNKQSYLSCVPFPAKDRLDLPCPWSPLTSTSASATEHGDDRPPRWLPLGHCDYLLLSIVGQLVVGCKRKAQSEDSQRYARDWRL